VNWYGAVWRKYATFDGRARRKEYWYFVLLNNVVFIGLSTADIALGLSNREGSGPLGGFYSLAALLPSLAVAVRRMHDTDHSGWWILLPPVSFFFALADGTQGSNRFGTDPKAESALSPAGSSAPPSASAAPAGSAPPARIKADSSLDRELLSQAAELGRRYADDVSELGDDAVVALRSELERSFGPTAVAESWTRIRPLLATPLSKGGSSD
jgi:uncharacterized membrane protein YhaH (DUF805 family)